MRRQPLPWRMLFCRSRRRLKRSRSSSRPEMEAHCSLRASMCLVDISNRRPQRLQRATFARHDNEMQFHAFDILVSDGDDSASCPSACARPTWRGCWRAASTASIWHHSNMVEIGPDLFRHACLMGLEGMVSKHRESTYRGGRSDPGSRVKNRKHPGYSGVQDQF